MNLNEFMTLYANHTQKQKVDVTCGCGVTKTVIRERALQNINDPKNNGQYVCRSCGMKRVYELNPRTEETNKKIGESKKGKPLSEESKRKMSETKKAYFQTPEGRLARKKLSLKASEQSSCVQRDKSTRKVLYISEKNGGNIRVCLSSYEFIACLKLEADSNVKSYETQISYEVEDKYRSLDFLITYVDNKKEVIEVKPKKRLEEEFHAKQMKDSAAYAASQGFSWQVWTEEQLNITNCKEATRLADQYKKQHYLVDHDAYRKERLNKKAKRHYDSKIGTNRIIIYCQFCKKYHTQLKITYDKNVRKNGRYICTVENGHTVGKKGKFHLIKENPHSSEGKKQCNGICGQVLPFSSFSTDPTKRDGHCTICKECRNKSAMARYNAKKSEIPYQRVTFEDFLARAVAVHGDVYDYSKANYKNMSTPVTIICKEHGEFVQNPYVHTKDKCGCPQCGIIKSSRKLTLEDFLVRANTVHGDRYDYSKVEYKNNSTKVIIICRKHGEFPQQPDSHFAGRGCPACAKENKIKS